VKLTPRSDQDTALRRSDMSEPRTDLALIVHANETPAILSQVTRVMADHGANIVFVHTLEHVDDWAETYYELKGVRDAQALMRDVAALPIVGSVEETPPIFHIYGKQIIVIGGGAQVGQVAMGAISEADRHNIRGERISIDTIPLVGEANIAAAVRAVARLSRARALVLAGALMGGDITRAVREIRERGVTVISLNMAGSAPKAADLIVSDPVQAGVMAVMAVASTASFDIARQAGRCY
jgi:energy-converting hydrogenase B subunit Q